MEGAKVIGEGCASVALAGAARKTDNLFSLIIQNELLLKLA